MPVRIPKPVNALFDWMEGRPLVVGVFGAFLGSLAVTFWWPSPLMTAVAGLMGVVAGVVWRDQRVHELRQVIDRLTRENAKKDEQLRRVDRGDANALTQRLYTIPDGE